VYGVRRRQPLDSAMMAATELHVLMGTHRDALIASCKAKATLRLGPTRVVAVGHRGIAMFVDQVLGELFDGRSRAVEIAADAGEHGRHLLRHQYTPAQIVHEYDDVCQSVTDLALAAQAQIGSADFRTLDRCVDDAIAGAVTEYARTPARTNVEPSPTLSALVSTAIAAFAALQAGSVGVTGSTGVLLGRTLDAMKALVGSPELDGA